MCHCGKVEPFSDCCEPIIKGVKTAQTAEQLMRSRYSAYVLADVAYLISTTHPTQQKNFDEAEIREWAETNFWQKLEVLATKRGTQNDDNGEVEFKAHYLAENKKPEIHHEKSTFTKENGKWFYLSGVVGAKMQLPQTQNRNDLCACGSGKKFKKCCGR